MVLCGLCASATAEWLVQVDHQAGDGFALARDVQSCSACVALIEAGSVDELAARLTDDFADPGQPVIARHLAARVIGTVPVEEDPSTLLGRAQGFSALSSVTGVVETLGPLWPERDRLSREELGEGEVDPDDRWLVRSPWPALGVDEVLVVLWRWVERDPYPVDPRIWESRVLEVFSWDERRALELLRGV